MVLQKRSGKKKTREKDQTFFGATNEALILQKQYTKFNIIKKT